jgi:hypothetical protein
MISKEEAENEADIEDAIDYSDHPEHKDAISPIFDYLKLAKMWWILEVFPTKGKMQVDDGEWQDHYLCVYSLW